MDKPEEKLQDLVRDIIRQHGSETPPGDFTEKVMARIGSELTSPTALKYRPLITGRLWLIIGVGIVFLLAGLVAGYLPSEITGMDPLNLPPFRLKLVLPSLKSLNLSRPLEYGLLAFTFFVFLFIALLKTPDIKRRLAL